MDKKTSTKLDPVDSAALLLKCNLSQNTYQQIKNVSDNVGNSFLATYKEVQKIKKECLPTNIEGLYRFNF